MKKVGGREEHGPVDSFPVLDKQCALYMDDSARSIVQRAYEVAARAHGGVVRKSGEPYIEHPLAVALWLAERQVNVQCIAAALLHDVVEDTPFSLQRLQNQFGIVIAHLVDGVTKFEVVESTDEEGDEVTRIRERKNIQQAETLRKLFLAMAENPHVALIKLADRLHNMRTLAATRPDRQIAKAHETLDNYVPLAHRLGMAEVKTELQDISLMYLDPKRYAWLKDRITDEVANRAERTEATRRALLSVLEQQGIDAVVMPHVKHIYSVNDRIAPTGIDVHEINDLIIYRVLVTTRRECYVALQAIHGHWQPLDARLRDYTGGSQKANGYQSIHTTVFGFESLFDVHIRTHEMHHIAEWGPVLIAASQPNAEVHTLTARNQAMAWIEQVRSWHRDLALSATDFVASVRDELFNDQIFVFTPKGDVRDLPDGATALDMAYRIHTKLGNKCVGANIIGSDNIMRREEPDYVLTSGDTVHIIADETVQPDASWLRKAKTRHAQDAILHYLRSHDLPTEEQPTAAEQGAANLLHHAHLGLCCEPGPDDELIGVPRGKHLVVHRVECHYVPPRCVDDVAESADNRHAVQSSMLTIQRNGHALLSAGHSANGHVANESSANGHGSNGHAATTRFVRKTQRGQTCLPVRWEMVRPTKYRVSLGIVGHDRGGLMHDVADVIANANFSVVRVGAHTSTIRVKATIWVTFDVPRPEDLQRVWQRLLGVDGVVSIERRHRVPLEKHR